MIRYWVEYSFDSYYMRLKSSFTCDSSYITEEVKNKLFESVSYLLANKQLEYFRVVRVEDNGSEKYFHFTRENTWVINLIDIDWFKIPENEVIP